jgi:hypothetical protein
MKDAALHQQMLVDGYLLGVALGTPGEFALQF